MLPLRDHGPTAIPHLDRGRLDRARAGAAWHAARTRASRRPAVATGARRTRVRVSRSPSALHGLRVASVRLSHVLLRAGERVFAGAQATARALGAPALTGRAPS